MKEKIIIFIGSLMLASELMTMNAAAYIDPSAASYIVQIVVGILIGAGTIIGVVATRIKKKARDALGIDFEKKEDEDEVHVYDNADIDDTDMQ